MFVVLFVWAMTTGEPVLLHQEKVESIEACEQKAEMIVVEAVKADAPLLLACVKTGGET